MSTSGPSSQESTIYIAPAVCTGSHNVHSIVKSDILRKDIDSVQDLKDAASNFEVPREPKKIFKRSSFNGETAFAIHGFSIVKASNPHNTYHNTTQGDEGNERVDQSKYFYLTDKPIWHNEKCTELTCVGYKSKSKANKLRKASTISRDRSTRWRCNKNLQEDDWASPWKQIRNAHPDIYNEIISKWTPGSVIKTSTHAWRPFRNQSVKGRFSTSSTKELDIPQSIDSKDCLRAWLESSDGV